MRYTIDVMHFCPEGDERIVHRAVAEAIAPRWAKSAAEQVMRARERQGANGVPILNSSGTRFTSGESRTGVEQQGKRGSSKANPRPLVLSANVRSVLE
jgi:ribosomal protein S3